MDAPCPAVTPDPNWVSTLYDDLLADMLLRREDVATEISFLIDILGLLPGMRVLDQGCGIGSLSVPLALHGMAVIGIDQAAAYIAEAQAAAARANASASFEQADAASYRPQAPVHGAFSWWTSWGHAPDDAGNLGMLRAVHDALVPGGTFVLDTMNVCGVLRGFSPEVVLRRIVPRLAGEVELRRLSRIDAASGVLHKEWIYRLLSGEVVRRTSAMRLYLPWQIAEMLSVAGFAEIRMLGSMAGDPLELDSPRLIAVARRGST